jgi:hypothetical protein
VLHDWVLSQGNIGINFLPIGQYIVEQEVAHGEDEHPLPGPVKTSRQSAFAAGNISTPATISVD